MSSPVDSHPAICCPLCLSHSATEYHQDKTRHYWHCQNCDLVFVDALQHLSADDEKQVYQQHENNPDDQGYRKFLSRMADPIQARIKPNSKGLDFGSGPGPTLSIMLTEQGHDMEIYDLYFANHPERLTQDYDFITSTEVFEHLGDPKTVLEQLLGILKPGGYLGIMTKRVKGPEAFSRWHYKLDPTHITFFSEASFHWIAEHYQLILEVIDQDVVLLKKPNQ